MYSGLTIWYQITNWCTLSWTRLFPQLSAFLSCQKFFPCGWCLLDCPCPESTLVHLLASSSLSSYLDSHIGENLWVHFLTLLEDSTSHQTPCSLVSYNLLPPLFQWPLSFIRLSCVMGVSVGTDWAPHCAFWLVVVSIIFF